MPFWLETLYAAMSNRKADSVSVSLKKNDSASIIGINNEIDRINYILNRVFKTDGWEVWNRLYSARIIKEHRLKFCTCCEDFGEDLSFSLEYCLYCNRVAVISCNGYCHTAREGSIMIANGQRIRFNALNEVSYSLYQRLAKEDDLKNVRHLFPFIHYLLLDNQYRRLVSQGKISRLKEETAGVNRMTWMKEQTKNYLLISEECKPYFSNENEWKLSILKSHYLIHQNYNLLRIERRIKGLRL